MNDFLTILENHRSLLEERGYDEIGLGSPDKPGLFMQKLEYLFSQCIRNAEYNNDRQDFFIEAFGFFDNDNDIVRFKFHYQFDPVKKDIDLKSFSAGMDGIKRTFLIGPNMYHLIHASRVHNILSEERRLQLSGELTISGPDIVGMVKEQDDYLHKIGYYKTLFPMPPKFITDELKSALEQAIGSPSTESKIIVINRNLYFDHYDWLECSFHYVHNPIKMNLQLKSITATKDGKEKIFELSNAKTPITLQDINRVMKNTKRLDAAKRIADTVSKTKRHKL